MPASGRFYTGRAISGRIALPSGAQYCSRCQRTYGTDQPFCPLDGVALRPVPEELPDVGAVVHGRYLVRSRVADGGMGTVFRATDLRGRREVALKILRPALAAKEAAVGRFFIEARAAGRLRHPNVVEMFDFGVSREGWLFLSMEFLPGETLADRIGRQGRLPVGEAVLVSLGIAEALVHAHLHGVIHRDMKPENVVLVDWDCEGAFVKVLDFGIAAIADSPVRGALHRGEVLGTPAYMSPEQVRGDVVDPRSDLYSLGVLLYEAIAGSPPFPGLSAAEVMRQHLAEAPPPLPALVVPPEARQGLEALVAGLLRKDPEGRPASAGVVRDRLRGILDALALDRARAVDTGLLGEVLAPLRTLVPFHERATLEVASFVLPGDAAFHDRPTMLLGEGGLMVAASTATAPGARVHLATLGPRIDVPWTLSPVILPVHASPVAPRVPAHSLDDVEVSLVHVELDLGPECAGLASSRLLFTPEMEAFESGAMAAGGCICFDSGDEVRLVFGLYDRSEEPWHRAVESAADLIKRARRFRADTGVPVEVRVGICTDTVSSRTIAAGSPDQALRGSPVDVAVRLARMALAGQVVLDEHTRRRTRREWPFEDLGQIRVRGREHLTRIFGLAGMRLAG